MTTVMFTFGSGGHSTEMTHLIKTIGLDKKPIKPVFLVSDDDFLVCDKIKDQFQEIDYKLVKLRRGRHVGQSYLTSIFTVILSMIQAIHIIHETKPKLLVTNGPALSVILSLALRMLQIITFKTKYKCRIIFVESFCRTKNLSLTAKIVYYMRLADRFLVQWPLLKKRYPRTSYEGLLV